MPTIPILRYWMFLYILGYSKVVVSLNSKFFSKCTDYVSSTGAVSLSLYLCCYSCLIVDHFLHCTCMASVLAIYGKISTLGKPLQTNFWMFLYILGYSKVVVSINFKFFSKCTDYVSSTV